MIEWIFQYISRKLKRSVVDLTRENLKKLPINWAEDEDVSENADYLRKGAELWKSDVLLRECEKIIKNEVEYIAKQSPNEQSSILARGTINGVMILREALESLNAQHEDRKAKIIEENINVI